MKTQLTYDWPWIRTMSGVFAFVLVSKLLDTAFGEPFTKLEVRQLIILAVLWAVLCWFGIGVTKASQQEEDPQA